ncbi:hypothetical protein ANN_15256 [Periplaneta americana]|uniref:Uncharacterized protein n=1 Tax=Periplaneta americana TaxID=6978 RepID=A0ABQ8SFX2_PERAM|nr:hypothetical protein ANN_15256 [Periplaneta americana]
MISLSPIPSTLNNLVVDAASLNKQVKKEREMGGETLKVRENTSLQGSWGCEKLNSYNIRGSGEEYSELIARSEEETPKVHENYDVQRVKYKITEDIPKVLSPPLPWIIEVLLYSQVVKLFNYSTWPARCKDSSEVWKVLHYILKKKAYHINVLHRLEDLRTMLHDKQCVMICVVLQPRRP